jgi:hypothetical protein
MNICAETNDIWFSKRSCAKIQVLFELLSYLTKVSNRAMAWTFEVMLRQNLKHSVYKCVILDNVISFWYTFLTEKSLTNEITTLSIRLYVRLINFKPTNIFYEIQ